MPRDKEIIIAESASELSKKGADIFLKRAKKSVSEEGPFTVALSGGSTPRGMHSKLGEEPYYSGVPWHKIHFFWVDERCVPADDPASNYGLAKRDFLDRIPIPLEQVHPMPGDAPPEEGAKIYREKLMEFFHREEKNPPAFDLIFLGVGVDGHTGSLFPGQEPELTSQGWVAAVRGGRPDVYRLTLTYDLLNRGKQICFLVSGKEKALIVKSLWEETEKQLPAQKIRPVNGKLIWLLDREAAFLL